jgi:hypothetical protein
MRERLASSLQYMLDSHRPSFAMMPGYVASNLADNLLFLLALLDRLGIEYVAHYGTLLGAARLGGLAPWDEDADVYIVDLDFEALQARIGAALAAHGFEAFLTESRDALIVRQVPWVAGQGHIGVSLWPGTLDDRVDPREMEWDAYMRHSEYSPPRRYPFYGSYVTGPAQPDPVLDRLYGLAGSIEVMERFRAPQVSPAQVTFWSRARPIDGDADWDAISARFVARARGVPWHAATFPWWWFNGAYNIGVRTLRKLGHAMR